MENHTPACRARKLPRRDENEVRTQLSKKTPLVKKLVNNSYYRSGQENRKTRERRPSLAPPGAAAAVWPTLQVLGILDCGV